MKIYHVVTHSTYAEIDVIKEVQPPRLLLSYFYFKNRPLKDFIKLIGYRPQEILMDSGAYSAFTKGKSISLIDYLNYLNDNRLYINNFISLDVIGDSLISLKYFEIMELKGLTPIPVYHFGENESYLKTYIEKGAPLIALGNTVPINNKKIVAAWINELIEKHPSIKFHLLGSSSKKITEHTSIYSCDSSTWFKMAMNGKPKHIKGVSRDAKIKRAVHNLKLELEAF